MTPAEPARYARRMTRVLLVLAALVTVGCGHSSGGAGGGGFDSGLPTCAVDLEAGASCELGGPLCFECNNGDGFQCSCETDSGADPNTPDAAIWFCVGTGYTCP